MTAPTNQPVVGAISLTGPAFIIGQTTNEYQPSKIATWNAVHPSVPAGADPVVGYAAFSSDGINAVTTSSDTSDAAVSARELIGVFVNYYYQEGNVGSNPWSVTMGNNYQVPVMSEGSVYAYNGGVISPSLFLSGGTAGILQVVLASTSPQYPIGSFFQGTALPSLVTAAVDVSGYMRPRTAGTVSGSPVLIGSGFLLEISMVS